MSKQYDILKIVLKSILDNTALFIDKEYMTDIFLESKAILLPFRDFIKYKYEEN